MSDWTGSEAQRRKHGCRDQCFYPHARPTPKPILYVIPQGTKALIKRGGDKTWRQFTTTKPLEFDSVYRKTGKSLIFFRVGFLLCVQPGQIETARQGASQDA